jgi:hypothetical protein
MEVLMVELTQPNGTKCMVASDSVAAIFPGPTDGGSYKTIISIKAWSEEACIEVTEDYEAVKKLLNQDDLDRERGRV